MDNSNFSHLSPSAGSSQYAPAVPMSLYKEVTAELQVAQAKLASLQAHNQQLVQQNQQLRQEVETIVQQVVQLQNAVNSAQALNQVVSPSGSQAGLSFSMKVPNFVEESLPGTPPLSPLSPVTPTPATSYPPAPDLHSQMPQLEVPAPAPTEAEFYTTEEPDPASLRRRSQTQPPELKSTWLVVIICLIMIAAFGAGFLFVRPLLYKGTGND